MATFVLVHGSNGGGWVWQKVAPLLCAAGHEVYTPTLTGLAERSHLLECGINLTTHITDVVNLLAYEDLSPVPAGDTRSNALQRVFIRCTGNPPTTPDVFGPFAAKARAKGWEVRDPATGHLAMLTAPDELASMLLELDGTSPASIDEGANDWAS